jgi:hypothetical protein
MDADCRSRGIPLPLAELFLMLRLPQLSDVWSSARVEHRTIFRLPRFEFTALILPVTSLLCRALTIQTGGPAASTALVWQLLHAGASDVLVWSSAADIAARIKARFERWNAIDALIQSPVVKDKLIGVSSAWRAAAAVWPRL